MELTAPYLAEMVRREMLERYGPEIYTAGYRVTTTVDSELQTAAVYAVRNGLLEYDRRHGYRGPLTRVDLMAPAAEPAEGTNGSGDHGDPDEPMITPAVQQTLQDFPEPGGLRVGVVTAVGIVLLVPVFWAI